MLSQVRFGEPKDKPTRAICSSNRFDVLKVSRVNLRKLRLPCNLLSQKGVTCLRAGVCLLSLILLVWAPLWAQLGIPAPAPVQPEPEVPKDSLGRTTPRGTVLGF